MLKTLILKNLILVETAEISFEKGLTTITGETGSGKTALLEAIKLLIGERADATKVRSNAEKAFIQGEFDIPKNSSITVLLEEHGITLDQEGVCVITREISSTGKSRCFISGQLAPLHVLQKISPFLVEIVDQHAHVALRNEDAQRNYLDLFAHISLPLQDFQEKWNEEKNLYQKYEKLKKDKDQSEERKLWVQNTLEELKVSDIKEKEEEELFKEYTYLANIQELLEKGFYAIEGLSATLPQLFQLQQLLREMHQYDSNMKQPYQNLKECYHQLEEIKRFLQSKLGDTQTDSSRLATLEQRLKLIDKLHKKYGKNLQDLQKQYEQEWLQIEDVHTLIDQIYKEYKCAQEKTNLTLKQLTKERMLAGEKLALVLSQNLQELNIPSAKVVIQLQPCARSFFGEDKICFYLQTNIGEALLEIKDHASGGELARLLFCLKIALANKNHAPTLVFDEIDASVGGKTADLMGKKLRDLGKDKQILCITHFPQVAKHAEHHFCILKQEKQGRTITKIMRLDQEKKHRELLRMLGENTLQNKKESDPLFTSY